MEPKGIKRSKKNFKKEHYIKELFVKKQFGRQRSAKW